MATAKKKLGTHLFIDTNVLLNFYAYSNDDLQQLEKLVKLLDLKTVKLYLTQQVVDEFYRNRDSKLADSFNTFRPSGNTNCPSFMLSLSEYENYKQSLETYTQARKILSEKARALADARELLADQLFARIADQASIISTDEEAYGAAIKRSRLGNPPGKSSSSVGDELNWELLLAHVPGDSDLHVITKDGDYASKLNPTQPKSFLIDEWRKIKNGGLHLYEQIGHFFSANYPDEQFSLEIEKLESISALVNSGSFASTHSAVALLEPYIPFLNEEEAEEVIQGALSNSQVAWIASDSDVEAFLTKMYVTHGNSLSATLKQRLIDALGLEPAQPVEVAAVQGESEYPF